MLLSEIAFVNMDNFMRQKARVHAIEPLPPSEFLDIIKALAIYSCPVVCWPKMYLQKFLYQSFNKNDNTLVIKKCILLYMYFPWTSHIRVHLLILHWPLSPCKHFVHYTLCIRIHLKIKNYLFRPNTQTIHIIMLCRYWYL